MEAPMKTCILILQVIAITRLGHRRCDFTVSTVILNEVSRPLLHGQSYAVDYGVCSVFFQLFSCFLFVSEDTS